MRKTGVFLAAAILMGSTFGSYYVSAQDAVEMQGSAELMQTDVKLCAEDRYVLFYTGEGTADIYDYQGNYLDSCRCYLDPLQVAATVKKDSLVEYSDGTTCTVFSFAQMKNILDFAAEYYEAVTYGSVCMVINRQNGSYTIFDNLGNVMYDHAEASWAEGGFGYGRIIKLENGYIFGICEFEDSTILESARPVWMSKDGTQVKEIEALNLQAAFRKNELEGFGDNVIHCDWLNGVQEIYSLEGERLLKDISNYVYPYMDERNGFFYDYNAELVCKNEDGMYKIYDTDLNEIASFVADENYYPDYAGGFLTGIVYPELGGRACEGFAIYNGYLWVPYTRTETGCIVYVNGETVELALKEHETLSGFTDTYVIAGNMVDGYYNECLYDRKTGELLQQSSWGETGGTSVQLCSGGYYIQETLYENETYSNSLTIYDNSNQICLQSDHVQCYVWQDNYFVMTRGIYRGITDQNGNWILRTIADWEE